MPQEHPCVKRRADRMVCDERSCFLAPLDLPEVKGRGEYRCFTQGPPNSPPSGPPHGKHGAFCPEDTQREAGPRTLGLKRLQAQVSCWSSDTFLMGHTVADIVLPFHESQFSLDPLIPLID